MVEGSELGILLSLGVVKDGHAFCMDVGVWVAWFLGPFSPALHENKVQYLSVAITCLFLSCALNLVIPLDIYFCNQVYPVVCDEPRCLTAFIRNLPAKREWLYRQNLAQASLAIFSVLLQRLSSVKLKPQNPKLQHREMPEC